MHTIKLCLGVSPAPLLYNAPLLEVDVVTVVGLIASLDDSDAAEVKSVPVMEEPTSYVERVLDWPPGAGTSVRVSDGKGGSVASMD